MKEIRMEFGDKQIKLLTVATSDTGPVTGGVGKTAVVDKLKNTAGKALLEMSELALPVAVFVEGLAETLASRNLNGVEAVSLEFGVSCSGGTDIKIVNAGAEGFLTVKLELTQKSLASKKK